MKRYLAILGVLLLAATLLLATVTPYTQPFAASHGWTYTQLTCSGGATCLSNNNVTTDGNPANSVSVTTAGKSKAQTGYWSHSYTWSALGLPAGEIVTSLTLLKYDMKASGISTTTCLNTSNGGVEVYDAANTTNCLSAIGGSGTSTASWATTDDTQSRTWTGACGNTTTDTVTLRLDTAVNSGGGSGPSCTVFFDNFTLTITSSTPPAGVRKRVMVTYR